MHAPSTPLRIAVLIIPPVQLLDLSPVDLFHMLSKRYLTDCSLPAPLVDLGIDTVDITYVTEAGAGLADTTAALAVRVTCGLDGEAVRPGVVDVLLVPGPDPGLRPSEPVKAFVRGHVERGTTVMSVCTGVVPLACAGVLDGRVCTGPRALLGMFLRRDFPAVKWVEKRWVVDVSAVGELWTAGGITNGQDMVAAFIGRRFDARLAELVCRMADVGGRGQEYVSGSAVEGMGWGWLLFRSWVGGLFGRKR